MSVMGVSSNSIFPLSALKNPNNKRIREDFPDPLGPTTARVFTGSASSVL